MGRVDDFIKLINEDPKNAKKHTSMLKDFSSDELAELHARIKPYQHLKGAAANKTGNYKGSIVSFTNLRQEYITRLVVTAFSGLFYRYCENEFHLTEKDREVRLEGEIEQLPLHNTSAGELDLVQRRLVDVNKMMETIKQYTSDVEALEKRMLDAELVTESEQDKTSIDNMKTLVRKYRSDIAELHYLMNITLAEIGKDSGKRVQTAATECSKFQQEGEAAQTVRSHPNPNVYKRKILLSDEDTRKITMKFLDSVLNFNVSKFIAPSLQPDELTQMKEVVVNAQKRTVHAVDPSRLSYESLLSNPVIPEQEHLEAVMTIMKTHDAFNAVKFMLREGNEQFEEIMKIVFANREQFQMYLSPIGKNADVKHAAKKVPAMDLYYRFNRYFNDNYESIREIVNTIYPDKPYFDCVIGLHTSVSGTEEQIRKQVQEYAIKQNVQEELFTVLEGHYTYLGPWKKNRDASIVYNRNNDIIKKIDERTAADKVIGDKLLKDRVQRKKMENIAAEGPDAPGLSEWVNTNSVTGRNSQPPLLSNELKMRMEEATQLGKDFKELEAIKEEDAQIEKYESLSKVRPLSSDEQSKLEYHRRHVAKLRAELETPDDMIMSNVISINADGTATEDVVYLETQKEDEPLSAHIIKM